MSNKNQNNNIPKVVFTPFKTCKIMSVIFICLSMILSIIIFINVITKKYNFTPDELKNFADFTLNIIFVIAALGFTIFTLPISQAHPEKDKILFSYIGNAFVFASIAILTYIISFCAFFPDIVFGLYFCVMFFILCISLTKLLATIIAYFNIRD